MRVHARKQSQLQQQASLNLTGSLAKPLAAGQIAHPRRPPDSKAQGLSVGPDTAATPHFAHDFSRILVHSKAPVQVQTKLTVNTPGDIYEQEANRVAEQVTTMPEALQRICPSSRGCTNSQNEQATREHFKAKPVNVNDSSEVIPPIVHEVLLSSGQPLDATTRGFMEPRFGRDFSQVRVHTDAQATESTEALTALAYTVGQDIVFRAGHYSPETTVGKSLLAHELTHTVQQVNGGQANLAINRSADRCKRGADRTVLAPTRVASSPVCCRTRLGAMRQLMKQQADIPKANQPQEGPNVKQSGDTTSQIPHYESISSDLRKLNTLNISGSVFSTSSDVKTLSAGVTTLRSVMFRMDNVAVSQNDASKITAKVFALRNVLSTATALPPPILKQRTALDGFSAASFEGTESAALPIVLEVLGEIVMAIAAILEAPIVIIVALIALIVLILYLIYELIMAIVEAADRALCGLLYEQCVERRITRTPCDDCLQECNTNNGEWPFDKCRILGIRKR